MFFAALDGAVDDPPVAEALAALGGRVETLKVLGSYPAIEPAPAVESGS
jgi:prephenate dehydratase